MYYNSGHINSKEIGGCVMTKGIWKDRAPSNIDMSYDFNQPIKMFGTSTDKDKMPVQANLDKDPQLNDVKNRIWDAINHYMQRRGTENTTDSVITLKGEIRDAADIKEIKAALNKQLLNKNIPAKYAGRLTECVAYLETLQPEQTPSTPNKR